MVIRPLPLGPWLPWHWDPLLSEGGSAWIGGAGGSCVSVGRSPHRYKEHIFCGPQRKR